LGGVRPTPTMPESEMFMTMTLPADSFSGAVFKPSLSIPEPIDISIFSPVPSRASYVF
jgi:hypothetical protein